MLTIIEQSVAGIAAMVSGAIGFDNLQGPIGIAQNSGHVASQGFVQFLAWIGIVSTAIGFLNLFPIGARRRALRRLRDRGGAGRPPSPAVMQVAMSIGLGLILLLMVFATYNDIMRMVS